MAAVVSMVLIQAKQEGREEVRQLQCSGVEPSQPVL